MSKGMEQIYIGLGRICQILTKYIGKNCILKLEKRIPYIEQVFDRKFYLNNNPDVLEAGIDPLDHYILYGGNEGRDPSPLFDTQYYLEQVSIPKDFPFTPLAHFLLIGRKKRISPTPWFDFSFYERHNVEVSTRKMCPYIHFIMFGLPQNRQASAHFDPQAYLESLDEDIPDKPALLHFLEQREHTRHTHSFIRFIQNLRANYASEKINLEHKVQNIEQELYHLPDRKRPEQAKVHIVLPVYDGYETTLRTLYTLFSSRNDTPWELTVINDCSPDRKLSDELVRLAEKFQFDIIEHKENKGFVLSVNEGFRHHEDLDVILLNSDVEVYNDWIDRLTEIAGSDERIATITPLSNNATICSYPEYLKNNVIPLELSYERLDRLAAEVNAHETVTAPTGVGFCMYITRKALATVGEFDAETFGRGYGEENDFCMRAMEKGFRNVIAANVFVRHVGGVSFGREKRQRMKEALEAINRKHPGYDSTIQEFIKADPLKKARFNLDRGRLHLLKKKENVVFLGLIRGGGAELAMSRHMAQEREKGRSVFLFVPRGEGSLVSLLHLQADRFPNIPPMDVAEDKARIVEWIKDLDISHMEIHHLIDLSMEAPRHVLEICREAGITFNFHVHDYLCICPRINLVDRSGIYCGEKGLQQCQSCLKGFFFKNETVDIVKWREMYERLLREAKHVIVPSEDVQIRLARYFPDVKIQVRPHEDRVVAKEWRFRHPADDTIEIAAIGAIGPPKGVDVLLSLARHVYKKRKAARLTVIGYTSMDPQLKKYGVKITGAYGDDHVQTLIDEVDPDCIFLPSVCPETYSFTLSHAIRSGRPIVAFRLGAIAERLRDHPHALLLDLEIHDEPETILDKIEKFLQDVRRSGTDR